MEELQEKQRLGLEKAEVLCKALNDAIDYGIYSPTRTLMYSIDVHFSHLLKPGLTEKGNPGFEVDEVNLKNRIKFEHLNNQL